MLAKIRRSSINKTRVVSPLPDTQIAAAAKQPAHFPSGVVVIYIGSVIFAGAGITNVAFTYLAAMRLRVEQGSEYLGRDTELTKCPEAPLFGKPRPMLLRVLGMALDVARLAVGPRLAVVQVKIRHRFVLAALDTAARQLHEHGAARICGSSHIYPFSAIAAWCGLRWDWNF